MAPEDIVSLSHRQPVATGVEPEATWVIATAGWSIPRASAAAFPLEGTHLQRYAAILQGAEINSSFHRPHTAATYAKWSAATPADFRFAVKLPRAITHDRRLRRVAPLLDTFMGQVAGLGSKRGPLLVQLPPSFAFDARVATRFFALLRARDQGLVALEPRHRTWWSSTAERLLVRFRIARVAADPVVQGASSEPGGWPDLVYIRLHGSPRTYWSRYSAEAIATLAASLRNRYRSREVWSVFDNTASGAAIENALELRRALEFG
jgi:uncharacterized protein YecE (DUF72 family)